MRLSDRKKHLAETFGAAAGRYDAASALQRHAAQRLALHVRKLHLPSHFRALEIGCGTGNLTRRLVDRMGAQEWVITDISSQMLEHCKKALEPLTGCSYRIMDGEAPDVDGPFDLIVSNLAFQWFDDISAAIDKLASLLAPGGRMAYTTLADASVQEWRRAHTRHGLSHGILRFPQIQELKSMWPEGGSGQVEQERLIRRYPSARAFLTSLRDTGAFLPAKGHTPLSPSSFRKVLREVDGREFPITYHLAYCYFTKDVK